MTLACLGAATSGCAVGVEPTTPFDAGEAGPSDAGDDTGGNDPTESDAGSADDDAAESSGDRAGESDDDGGSSDTGVPECGADLDSDPLHCGACNHDCQGGGCNGGVCQSLVLATGVSTPWHMRVRGSALFVGADDGVSSIPIDGGARTILAGGRARGLVVDDDSVYWVDDLDHSLYTAPVAGGARELLVVFITQPYPLEADDDNLYWIDQGVMKRAKHDGTAHVIVPPDGTGFVPWQLAVDDARVYWRSEDGELRSADKNGGGDTVLATGNEMRAVAVNSTHVFAMRRDGFEEVDTLLRIPKAGGPTEELIGGQPNVLPLLADEDTVYWATEFGQPTRIVAMPVAGGPVRVLAELASDNAIFTVHEHVLYYAEQEAGTISKLVL